MFTSTMVLFGIYFVLSLFLAPMQYPYIKALKEMDQERQKLGLTQEEYYNKMSFENQQLHFNAQGNPLFIGANLVASLYYKWKNKQ